MCEIAFAASGAEDLVTPYLMRLSLAVTLLRLLLLSSKRHAYEMLPFLWRANQQKRVFSPVIYLTLRLVIEAKIVVEDSRRLPKLVGSDLNKIYPASSSHYREILIPMYHSKPLNQSYLLIRGCRPYIRIVTNLLPSTAPGVGKDMKPE